MTRKAHNGCPISLFAKALLPLSLLGSGAAMAGQYDLWRSNQAAGDYFLRDKRTDEWVETINCHAAFRFKLNRYVDKGIRLYDKSRDVYVQLDGKYMWLHTPQSKRWEIFKHGAFDRRIVFQHIDKSGGITGDIWKKPGCVWQEFQGGTATPDFSFVDAGTTGSAVEIYDPSRNLYVQMTSSAMSMRTGGTDAFKFFKKGSWQYQ